MVLRLTCVPRIYIKFNRNVKLCHWGGAPVNTIFSCLMCHWFRGGLHFPGRWLSPSRHITSHMAPYSLNSALRLIRTHRVLVQSSALCREYGAIWDRDLEWLNDLPLDQRFPGIFEKWPTRSFWNILVIHQVNKTTPSSEATKKELATTQWLISLDPFGGKH